MSAGPRDEERADEREVLALVSLGGMPQLGGGGWILLALAPRRTVLVGRSGSGKSLIIAGLAHFMLERQGWRPTVQGTAEEQIPRSCVFQLARGKHMALSYISGLWSNLDGLAPETVEILREQPGEVCYEQGAQVWACFAGALHVSGYPSPIPWLDRVVPRAPEAWKPLEPHPAAAVMRDTVGRLSALVLGTRFVPAGIPRRDSMRAMVLLDRNGVPAMGAGEERRLVRLATRLWRWKEDAPHVFEAVAELGQRNRLWKRLEVVKYEASKTNRLYGVHADDINLGYLPDGTLRVLEIAVELADPEARLVLIEEPETGIHPWLLGRLLHEMDAVMDTRQIVISTHSPMVVDWARPEELRLVERVDDQTKVRGLDDEERARVQQYLNDEGTLAEYVYERTES